MAEDTATLISKLALVERDLQQVTVVTSKLESAIDKIGEATHSINKLLAVHQERVERQQSINEDLYEIMANHQAEAKASNAELHSRITTTTRELETKIDGVEEKLLDAIKDLKRSVEKEEEKYNERINQLEKSKYLLLGGGAAIGALLTKFLPILQSIL